MSVFNLFKKKKTEKNSTPKKTTLMKSSTQNDVDFVIHINAKGELVNKNDTNSNLNDFGKSWDKLTDEGDLPTGWIYHNREFVNKITEEYKYFHGQWIESAKKSPKDKYAPLKSYVLYLKDIEKLCKSKDECFEFWFNEILTYPGCVEEMTETLNNLTANMDELQAEYEKKQREQDEHRRKVIEMKPIVIEMLQANDGILQSEFWKLFDDESRGAVSDILYNLFKEGKVEKTKSGRSYILHFKGGDASN